MSGVLDYYKTAKAAGIKPILGIEAYVAARSRFDRDPAKDKMRYHLTIIAMNNQGYHNLMRLSTKANLEGMYYKPRIDHDLLEELNEGLIVAVQVVRLVRRCAMMTMPRRSRLLSGISVSLVTATTWNCKTMAIPSLIHTGTCRRRLTKVCAVWLRSWTSLWL